MNLAGCVMLTTAPENRVWFRAIQPRHWPTALQTAHSTRIPRRYSPATTAYPAFPILYLAEDHQVALFEVEVLLGSSLPGKHYLPNPRQAWTILNVQVTLQAVADLALVAEIGGGGGVPGGGGGGCGDGEDIGGEGGDAQYGQVLLNW